jgi:hypothetical protein
MFGDGDFRVGDHWLIPARTVRLVYGVTALSGTIEWPRDAGGDPAALPPLGPVHDVAALALLERATVKGTVGWTLVSDCRALTPALTELVTLDLMGGDGQAAAPGQPLPQPIRVAVRNGGVPVVGAPVRFATSGGHLAPGVPTTDSPPELVVATDARGHAEARWLLRAGGPDTQVLTATRLDDTGAPVDAEVRVTGRRDEPGGACLVIRPDTDLVRLFADLSGAPSLVLCLTAGTWQLPRPAVLAKVGTVIVTGAGASTRILSSADAALWFQDCTEVLVRDLHVASRPRSPREVTSALTILQAARVHVERVSARVAGGRLPVASGITVRSDQRVVDGRGPGADRVIVRDCRIEVGDAQTGVLVIDSARTDITGCEVTAVRDEGLVGQDTLQDWLRDAAFAEKVARRAVHPLAGEGERPLGTRTGFSEVISANDIRFGSEIDDPDGWSAYLRDVESTVEAAHEQVHRDLTTHNPQSRFRDERTRFAAWLRRVAAELAASPTAENGIVVAGSVARDVRICDNTITGALQGITAALRVSEENLIERLQVRGNTITPPPRSATGFVQQGIDVGHCRHLSVLFNAVTVPEAEELGYAIEGLRCAGRLGPHAVAFANTFAGPALGILVLPSPQQAGVILRVARDNVCTRGPVLVDQTGVWRDADNRGL